MLRRAMPSNTQGAVSLSKSSFRPSQGDCQSSLLSKYQLVYLSTIHLSFFMKTYRYAQRKKKAFRKNFTFL